MWVGVLLSKFACAQLPATKYEFGSYQAPKSCLPCGEPSSYRENLITTRNVTDNLWSNATNNLMKQLATFNRNNVQPFSDAQQTQVKST
jgi:hypothetical protein